MRRRDARGGFHVAGLSGAPTLHCVRRRRHIPRVRPFTLPPAIPRKGNAFLEALGWLVLRAFGWRFEGEVPNLPKLVAIVAPHTSNWDFPLGLAAKWALRLHVSFLGKHTLFKPPFGFFFRAIGGIPVNRETSQNLVEQMASVFAEREQLVLVIAPEGTRKKVAHWKTGFYHIARAAHVPILLIAFDYGRRVIRFGPVVVPSGDVERETAAIRAHYDGVRGKRPEHA